jgi:hypothetical protein
MELVVITNLINQYIGLISEANYPIRVVPEDQFSIEIMRSFMQEHFFFGTNHDYFMPLDEEFARNKGSHAANR